MEICKLTIVTSVDGGEEKIVRMGRIERLSDGVQLVYREESARVSLLLQKGTVTVRREGDYALTLFLKKGETTEGEMCIGGSVGNLPIQTYLLEYDLHDERVEIRLGYRLLFGDDSQDMQLQITAECKGEKR